MQRRVGAITDGTSGIDGGYAWLRLLASVLLATIGGVGLWSVVVALPTVEAEFGVARAGASLPYTATMIGFAFGAVLMGRLADRYSILMPLAISSVMLCVGYVAASHATTLYEFILAQGLLIGMLGASTTFGPLVADISHWFERRRGIAVAICASGNYIAGTVWPPILRHLIDTIGWRQAFVTVGITCLVTMLPLSLVLRRRSPVGQSRGGAIRARSRAIDLPPRLLQTLLVVAGIACCVAMAMPQVHMVAYCGDLGYGTARGAELLSVMLGTGVISRLISGWISDRIGGVRTLLLGSALQMLALCFYLPFDGLTSLYVVSALFGLAQGGIVPSYAMIVRESFPPREAATRVSAVLMATIVGMALGGYLSGVIYDLTGSYQAAFLHGIAWNALHLAIAGWLWLRQDRPPAAVPRPA